ncbi:MAG TPA: adenylate/guanylate cyclase domain-containing protein [Anaerolineales bacterium]|nr:adenylate/guanylate cyclase domain-containing protein [Anaerolineales bacterium]
MAKQADKNYVENVWRDFLTIGIDTDEARQRNIFKFLPATQRCRFCLAPLKGISTPLIRAVYRKAPSKMNPHLCNACEIFAEEHQGGAEVELSLLFADVRGSTTLAESMSALEFSNLINRFYNVATRIMVNSDALIDKIIGDQVAAMYTLSLAGQEHPKKALAAAQELLHETGHHRDEGPWVPIGVGVHTGMAFVGSVGRDTGVTDITVLGDAPNTAARLASNANTGEILISNSAYEKINLDLGQLEERSLELKGKSQPVTVRVISSNA